MTSVDMRSSLLNNPFDTVNRYMLKRFPFISLACYTPYQYRVPRVLSEIRRCLGILPVQAFWQFPNPFDNILLGRVNTTNTTARVSHFSCSYNHYRMVKTAMTLGVDGYLCMEDDLSFLRDEQMVHQIIESLPGDADVAVFDWRTNIKYAKSNAESVAREVPGFLWHRADDMHLVGTGMYYLSRKGLLWYVKCVEQALLAGYFYPADKYFRPEFYQQQVVPYCAIVRPAIQDSYADCSTGVDRARREYSYAQPPSAELYNLRPSSATINPSCSSSSS